MQSCIYCGSSDNLNTQLTLSLESGKVTVDICDEHAEDASVKTARAKYMEKQDQIIVFMEQAKALGIEIPAQNPSGLIIAQNTLTSTPDPAPAPAASDNPEPASTTVVQQVVKKPPAVDPITEGVTASPLIEKHEADEGWVTTAKADSAAAKGMQSVGGSTEMGQVSSHASHVVGGQQDVLSEEARRGKVKMVVAEGRLGTPIMVPSKRVDGTGTTRIRIKNSEDDNTLQRRFKDMANDSKSDQQPDFRNGYEDSSSTCPICRGNCVINGKDCPKCDGMGQIFR